MTGATRTRWITTLIVLAALGTAACGNSPESDTTRTDTGHESSASTGSGPPDSGQVGDFCRLNDELARLFGELAQRRGADAEATWLNIEVVVDLLQDEAPTALAADVSAGTQYYATLGDALKAADYADPIAIVESVPQDAEMAKVESRTNGYLDATC